MRLNVLANYPLSFTNQILHHVIVNNENVRSTTVVNVTTLADGQ